jgi:hypothetical protein
MFVLRFLGSFRLIKRGTLKKATTDYSGISHTFYHYATLTLKRHFLCSSPDVVDERAALMVRIQEDPGLDLYPQTE